jgi:hypothetical protein
MGNVVSSAFILGGALGVDEADSDYEHMGGGTIRCPEDQFARLAQGETSRATECVDTCPDNEEPGSDQSRRCLPSYNRHFNTAPDPEVTLTPLDDGKMQVSVSFPLQPREHSEAMSLFPYTIDLKAERSSPQPDSQCNTLFQATAVHDNGAWKDQTGAPRAESEQLPQIGAPTILGWFRAGDRLHKTFTIQEGVQARVSVHLYIKSEAASSAGVMYVAIDSLQRFQAKHGDWCPSPEYNLNEPCVMECVLDIRGTGNPMSLEIGMNFGLEEFSHWGFRDFRVNVSQVHAEFEYDDLDEECSLSGGQAHKDLHEHRTGWLAVFWGGPQPGQDWVGRSYWTPVTFRFPRFVDGSTEEDWNFYAESLGDGMMATAPEFKSVLTLHADERSFDMVFRKFAVGDEVWAWQNLTTATHTLEVKEVFLSTFDDFQMARLSENKVGNFNLLWQETSPGWVRFKFNGELQCPEDLPSGAGCYVHVVSWTTPPGNTTTTTTPPSEAPERRLEDSTNQRRLDHHIPIVAREEESSDGRAWSVNTALVDFSIESATMSIAPVNAAEGDPTEVDIDAANAYGFAPIVVAVGLVQLNMPQ